MARIYVGTYAKYNDGNLAGEWLDLADYADKEEFLAACAELHKDEADPELMFQDWEGIPQCFIGESHIDAEFWDYLECNMADEVKAAYIACFGEWDAEKCEERYRGEFNSWTSMAEEFLEESGLLEEIPENLRSYFDFEAYARDMRLGGDMCEHDNHFFWNN